jgi:uncharacterized membrane protein YbhN (UPF0104 family)
LVLLALIALVYVVLALPVEALSEVRFQHLSIWFLPTITLMHVAYLLMSAEVWRRLVHTIAGTTTLFSEAYMQMVSVAAGKYVPGKVWGFVARTGQLSRARVPARLSVVTTVIEQIAVLFGGGLVVVCAALFVFPEYLAFVLLAGIGVLAALVVLSRHIPGVVRWVQRRRGIDEASPEDVDGGLWLWLKFTVAYAALWLINGLMLCVIYFSLFDGALTAQSLAALILANTVGFIVGFLAVFAPGGIGVREAITVAALSPFLPVREALIAAIALRAWMVLFDGLNCGIMVIAELRHASQRSD